MILGEKWFNNEEVIRIMTDVQNSIYKKKVKVYSETFNNYKWMEVNDIEYYYRKLIPVAFMYLTVVEANSASRNMEDLIIELRLNKNSVYVDEAQIEEEYCEYDGYGKYSTIFTRLNLLIDSTDALLKENYHILEDPDKSIQNKLEEIMDRFIDEDENFDAYESKLLNEDERIKTKDSIKLAIYVNDYYDSIISLLKPKLDMYNSLITSSFKEIQRISKIDFKITNLKQLLELYCFIPSIDVRLNIDDYSIKEAKPVLKDNDLNTLYTFDNETMMNIVKYTFVRTIHDYMIIKYWYDIDITALTYKYHLIRNSNNGDLFIIICKTGKIVYRI